MTGTAGVMIDRAGTVDRDDAIWVEATPGGWRATVHVADVAAVVPAGSAADREAARRCWSVYLPDRTVRMLPGPVERAAALRAAPTRTCVIEVDVDAAGNIYGVEVARGRLLGGVAMDHAEAAAALGDTGHPHHRMLSAAHGLARVLLARRRASGALIFYDLAHGWATDEEGNPVSVGEPERNAAYVIVQELMIAANEALASWSAIRGLPILYRNHRASPVAPPRSDLLGDMEAAAGDSGRLEVVRKALTLVAGRAEYAPILGGHYGLNVPAYAHATSPVRRYADLVTQRIVLAAVDRAPVPYPVEEVQEIAARINERVRQNAERRNAREQERRAAGHRQRLVEEEYEGLDADLFFKVVKVAAGQGLCSPALLAEIDRRAEAGGLHPRDLCQVLLMSDGEVWAPARRSALRVLTAEPAHAVTVLALFAVLADTPAPQYPDVFVGTVHRPVFSVTAQITAGAGTVRCSPPRLAASKRDARQQAALALVAGLAGLGDPSRDLAAVPAPQPDRPAKAAAGGDNPVGAVNEHAQLHLLLDVDWEFTADGPAHAREFGCTVTAVSAATGRQLAGTGWAQPSKAAAKAEAAAALLAALEEDPR